MDYQQPFDGTQPGVDRGNRFGTAPQEEKLNSRKPENAYAKVRGSAIGLVKDSVRLADLQFQLLAVDITQFWKLAKVGLIGVLIAAVVLLSSVTVLMFGIATQVETQTELSSAAAQAIVGGVAALLSLLVLLMSFRRLTSSGALLKRSQTEFQENLNWLRSVLSQGEEST